MPPRDHYVYILANRASTVLYTGVTNDLKRRVHEHKTNSVAGFTSGFSLNRLVYYKLGGEIHGTIGREKAHKGGSRRRKVALVHEFTSSTRRGEIYMTKSGRLTATLPLLSQSNRLVAREIASPRLWLRHWTAWHRYTGRRWVATTTRTDCLQSLSVAESSDRVVLWPYQSRHQAATTVLVSRETLPCATYPPSAAICLSGYTLKLNPALPAATMTSQ
jgi:putative endonuclease